MLKIVKSNDGFTLLEVIISVAALSLISVFILQMFISSSNLNDRAKDSDIGMYALVSEIEVLKSNSALEDYVNLRSQESTLKDNGTVTINRYYDDDWNPLPGETGKYHLEMDIIPQDSLYDEPEGVLCGTLYSINANMISTENNRSLVSFQAKKYFPQGGVGI